MLTLSEYGIEIIVRALRFLSVVKFRVLKFVIKCNFPSGEIDGKYLKLCASSNPPAPIIITFIIAIRGLNYRGNVSISFSTGDVMSLCNFAREALIYKGHYTRIGE